MIKKWLALCLSAFLMIQQMTAPVWAEEIVPVAEEQQEIQTITAEEALWLIDAVGSHLGIYGRDETISERKLYKAAVVHLVQENPEIYTTVLKAMLESIDAYSEYYTPEEAKTVMESINGEIIGIGITITFHDDGRSRVSSLIPGAPAEKAGIRVGDILYTADGKSLIGEKSELVTSAIRGEEGSTLHLEVIRDEEILAFDIVREPIIETSVEYEIHQEGEEKLMYIRVYNFIKNTAEKFREALKAAAEAGITNLIIDLRDNGGGIFQQAIEIANEFVPKEAIITKEDHKNPLFNVIYAGDKLEEKAPYDTVVLINENSASASEVLAAALYENDMATLIGTNSYGKGTIQTLNSLMNGAMIKYTSGYYLTPNGNNLNGVGLVPDTYVENRTKAVPEDRFGKFGYSTTYREGDRGEEVRTAKEILDFFGIFQGEINDVYDRDLYYAVYAFQKQTGLFPYGVLDLTTQGQIQSYLGQAKIIVDEQKAAGFAYFGMTMPEEEE